VTTWPAQLENSANNRIPKMTDHFNVPEFIPKFYTDQIIDEVISECTKYEVYL
jgi:hypothetical protein